MRYYYIYDLHNNLTYRFDTYQKRYALLRKLINGDYLVEMIYDRSNIKQYIVKKCHE